MISDVRVFLRLGLLACQCRYSHVFAESSLGMAIRLTNVDSLAAGTRILVNDSGAYVRWDSILEAEQVTHSC